MLSPRVDKIDQLILTLLRENGRRTVADIASRVNLSAAPVRRRIAQLEAMGVIAGYTAIIDDEVQLPSVDAYVEMRLSSRADLTQLADLLKAQPEVRELALTAGDPDIVVRLRVPDLARLKAFVHELRQNPGIATTKTMIVLESWAAGQLPSRGDKRPVTVAEPA
jgi:Lrp/AsnC family leucine-responsive transcriptional regulator